VLELKLMLPAVAKNKMGNHLHLVKSKNTVPELILRKHLWRVGLRYRLYYSKLPGKPDIVFVGKKVVIFVHGCYWHRHDCGRAFLPKTNSDFWQSKFLRNIQRDEENYRLLASMGWKVLILWECEIRKNVDDCIEKVKNLLALAKKTVIC
jgi:DNA mismatch endonuclease (patch repair protein)